ncbi:hypothetical protein BT93_H1332 [Corymbia citriodora subsp. variegata]|nr:hypothetical protein BT93_H1332 [Corymbia citriodora subsp. variegata]
MLRRRPLNPPTSPKHSIFRVRHQLRKVNEKAYDPEVLAIGPYHHGNDNFKITEEQKQRYLQQLLERRNEGSIDRYMSALRELEPPPRNCYAGTINSSLEGDNFLMMMVTDGCFIVELFRKVIRRVPIDQDDPVMHVRWIGTNITRDLLLLENQIPLVVLSKLYDLTKGPEEDDNFSNVADKFFNSVLGESKGEGESQGEHLLHLYHMRRTSGLPKTPSKTQQDCTLAMSSATEKDWIPSATELRESGVSFKAAQGSGLSGFKFGNGTLEIPFLRVDDETESRLRNLVAYEQHRQSKGINYFTDYVVFMDCLINTSNDVKVLCRKGIIKNYLDDDEAVVQMFNKICDHVAIYNFYYSEIFLKVNAYCDVWTVRLRRAYIHSPWALLPVPVAFSLLLTAVQTVFSILSYTKQS